MMAARRRNMHPVLAAEFVKQVRRHGVQRAIYLMQFAMNDIEFPESRLIPEDGEPNGETLIFQDHLDPARIAARMKAISPRRAIR